MFNKKDFVYQVVDFYNIWYTSDNIVLIISYSQSLDELQDTLVQYILTKGEDLFSLSIKWKKSCNCDIKKSGEFVV